MASWTVRGASTDELREIASHFIPPEFRAKVKAELARRRDVQLESARRDPRGLGDGCGTN